MLAWPQRGKRRKRTGGAAVLEQELAARRFTTSATHLIELVWPRAADRSCTTEVSEQAVPIRVGSRSGVARHVQQFQPGHTLEFPHVERCQLGVEGPFRRGSKPFLGPPGPGGSIYYRRGALRVVTGRFGGTPGSA